MNAPFKPSPIVPILADVGVSITELKRNPAAVVAAARSQAVAVLNRNRPVAYVIAPEVWDHVIDILDDHAIAKEMADSNFNLEDAVEVSIDDLCAEIPSAGAASMEKS